MMGNDFSFIFFLQKLLAEMGYMGDTTVFDAKEGFWKIKFHKIRGAAIIALDEQLPLWFSTDPALPLRILPQ